METKTQPQQNKHLFATGKNGIVTNFKRKSLFRGCLQIERTTESGRNIDAIAKVFISTQDLINRQPDGTKEKFKPFLKRIKGQAKSQIIKDCMLNDDHLDLFHFREADLAREIAFRKHMFDIILADSKPGTFFYNAMRAHAKAGHLVDFSFANALIDISNELIETDRNSPNDELPSEKHERHCRILELSDLINDELNLKNKEKALRPNLCYFLLYDETLALKPEYIERCLNATEYTAPRHEDYSIIPVEDENRLKEKVKNLSRTNLIELVRIYCIAHNDFYRKEILYERRKRKMLNNRKNYEAKKSFTPEETRGFVEIYMAAGFKQEQIAHEIGCGLRTVQRYEQQIKKSRQI